MPVAESGYYTLVRPGPVQVWRCERCQALIEVRPIGDVVLLRYALSERALGSAEDR